MTQFLDVRISTVTGIIVLLLVAGSVGFMIFYQLNQIMNVRAAAWEKQIDEIK
jgi:hypothetical protein